jgi:hypothetical protein
MSPVSGVDVEVDAAATMDFPSLAALLSIGLGKEVGQLLWR